MYSSRRRCDPIAIPTPCFNEQLLDSTSIKGIKSNPVSPSASLILEEKKKKRIHPTPHPRSPLPPPQLQINAPTPPQMRLHRPLLPPHLHEPEPPPQDPHAALVPRVHIRAHPAHAPRPERAVGPQQRGQRFGHVALAPEGAVQHEADFGRGGVPDAGFADDGGGGGGGGVGGLFGWGGPRRGCGGWGWGEEDDDEVEGAVCGGGEHGVEVLRCLVQVGVRGAGPVWDGRVFLDIFWGDLRVDKRKGWGGAYVPVFHDVFVAE